jgi:uncharacterized protein YodC (DUF2158 family)
MTTKKFKTGDVVTAKMGGPKMTVEAVREKTHDDVVQCAWFDQMFVLHRDAFDAQALKPAVAR